MNHPIIQARYLAVTVSGAKDARRAVAHAVARGQLPRIETQKCTDCGEQAQAYDHRDYGKPLDVQPVCDSCNARRGAAMPNSVTVEQHRNATVEYERGWKARMEPPRFVALTIIGECESYRDAVRMAWEMRSISNMTRSALAERIGSYPSHVTDYLLGDDSKGRRSLPADLIDDFEWAVGNRIVTQFLLFKAGIELQLVA